MAQEPKKAAATPNKPRQLPVVVINGRKYYRDDRLREFRAVDNPFDWLPL